MGKARASLLGLVFSLLLAGPAVAADSEAADRLDILGAGKKLYSQRDEELVIRDFFQDRKGGFFVDVGCAWPIRHSTTYYLEKHLGWSGIAIDALPDYAPWWKQERPNSRFFQNIVTDHSGSQETFYKAAWPGVSSTEKGRVIGGRKVNQQEIRVDSITLNDLLEREGVESVDFLSMDIEGAEPQALAGFDIQRFKPKLVCIEAMVHKRDELLKYFESHGYRLIERYQKRDPVNWYFEPVPSEKDPG